MPKKLQINAIPWGKVKLNPTSDGAGCYLAQCLRPGWGTQLAADVGCPMAGLGAVNLCGECHPGSTWSPGGQRSMGGVRDFHQFSLEKAPALLATPHPAMGHYSSSSPSPAAAGSDSGDAEKVVGGRRDAHGHLLPRPAASGEVGLW